MAATFRVALSVHLHDDDVKIKRFSHTDDIPVKTIHFHTDPRKLTTKNTLLCLQY